jgi:hypothetical protein
MSALFLKYGLEIEPGASSLDVELGMIRSYSLAPRIAAKYGQGLFHHYRAAMSAAWPEDDHHRWSDLILKTYLEERITVITGPRDCVSGDTRIPDPITGEQPTIAELCERQVAPTVMTVNGPEQAEIPFLKGTAELFEVTCANGSRFKATKRHFVSTPSGFVAVASLAPWQAIHSVLPAFPPSIAGRGPSIRAASGRRCLHCLSAFTAFRPGWLFSSAQYTAHETLVESVKSIGCGFFYDLEVPRSHHYFAEGFIHHNSSKTRTISKIGLLDYWAFPEDTLILMTSTTVQGLELRVWGDIKNLFRQARERYPDLPGNVVDAKHGLFTDDLSKDKDNEDVRVMNKGIIGIALINSSNEYQGSQLKNFAGIKQRRRRLFGDECFPAGTMVDTLAGQCPIESIVPGDLVLSAVGPSKVIGSQFRSTEKLVRVHCQDGRAVSCTPDHKFLTQKGWEKACNLSEMHYIMSPYEAMRVLRKKLPITARGNAVLHQILRDEISPQPTGDQGHVFEGAERGARAKTGVGDEAGPSNDREQSDEQPGEPCQSGCGDTSIGCLSKSQGRQWDWSNESRMAAYANVPGGSLEFRHQDGQVERKRDSSGVQSRSGISEREAGYRSRWPMPHELGQSEGERPQERRIPCGAWVERVEIQKQGDPRFPATGANSRGCRVHNLQVEGHPSYSVHGLLVHNCQFISTDYLKSLDSLDKGDFKAALLGNPIASNGKALDKVSEPKDGWGSQGEITKTMTWRNKYNGVTVALCGIDSPNFDPDTLNRYDYLINQKDVDTVAARPGGKDSAEWWSLIMGIRKAGVISDRVLTVEMVERWGGFGDCIWSQEPSLKALGVDAGFGGDPCVATYLECGQEVGGKEVMVFAEQWVIPITLSGDMGTAEDQIARRVKSDCARLGVSDSNVFVECGMRATLAVSMGRIMSPAINAINFGGPATERPVSNDMFVFDEKTKQRRFKTSYEHYSKFVTELAFAVRQVVESGQARKFPRQAAEEFQRRETRFVYGDRHELETKAEYKLRNGGESPNMSDSCMIAVEGARRLGFTIQRINVPAQHEGADNDWLAKELQKHRQIVRKSSLSYA